MARALWKGSIAFGLVNIPIELHTAIRNHRPKFRMLHAKDKSPVKFERVCLREGEPVAWEDLVKGYEYQKGHFVVLTKEDFQAAALVADGGRVRGRGRFVSTRRGRRARSARLRRRRRARRCVVGL